MPEAPKRRGAPRGNTNNLKHGRYANLGRLRGRLHVERAEELCRVFDLWRARARFLRDLPPAEQVQQVQMLVSGLENVLRSPLRQELTRA